MRKAMVLGVLTLAGSLASPAFADEFTGFHLGVQFSQDKLDGFYKQSAFGSTISKSDSNQLGYELFAGWSLNKYLAAEVGYHTGTHFNKDFPAVAALLDTNAATKGSEFYSVNQNIKSIDATVVGSWWINDRASFFGRAGFKYWRGKVSFDYGDTLPPPSVPATAPYEKTGDVTDNGFAPMFGIGFQTQLDHALVRFEYQYADIGNVAFGTNYSSTDNKFSSIAFSISWTL